MLVSPIFKRDGLPPFDTYRINRDSAQAVGLVGWLPGDTITHIDRIRGLVFSQTNIVTLDISSLGAFLSVATNGYLSATTPISAPPLTMTCWAQVSSTATRPLWGIHLNANNYHQIFSHSAGVIRAQTYDGATFASANTTVNYPLDEWFQAVMVVRGDSDRSAYINGGARGNNTSTSAPAGISTIAAGQNPIVGSSATFIKDCRVYDRALSDAEIWQLYDPATRWELYEPVRRIWPAVEAAAAPPGEGALLPILMQHGQYTGGTI